MIGMTNAGGSGTGCTLTITAPAGAAITVTNKAGKVKSKIVGANGLVVFRGLTEGIWTITISNGTDTATKTVEIKADYQAAISFNTIPEFTYTGDFEIVSDDDQPITTSQGNWKIRFLTSGTLTFTNLNGAENGIDVFLVGGGSGGGRAAGGGGYTKTLKAVKVSVGTAYLIEVGAGGIAGVGNSKAGSSGGTSNAFGASANGGKANGTTSFVGSDGGSGGGAGSANGAGGKGGSDGSDGFDRNGTHRGSGKGQGTTTREFGESGGKLYAGGGGGCTTTSSNGGAGGDGGGGDGGNTSGGATSGETNTGSGGGGAANNKAGGSGGSGIVIIRNTRGAA